MRAALLWLIAFLIMASAVIYQRRTGPTYPLRGSYGTGGETLRYRLLRSHWSSSDALLRLPLPDGGEGVSATLHYRRYKTGEEFTAVPFERQAGEPGDRDELVAALPAQPAAGKLEYRVEVVTPEGRVRIPRAGDDHVIIRFKDDVPGWALWPHVVLMFFSVLIGIRAGLAALFAPRGMRLWAWVALVGMTGGGMVLGPIVQKHAFGHFWTGFPLGGDLTDNKMLVMWLVWVVACAAIGLRARPREGVSRSVVVAASLVMVAVYLIPHSMKGSELDYSKLDSGVPAREAVGTGD